MEELVGLGVSMNQPWLPLSSRPAYRSSTPRESGHRLDREAGSLLGVNIILERVELRGPTTGIETPAANRRAAPPSNGRHKRVPPRRAAFRPYFRPPCRDGPFLDRRKVSTLAQTRPASGWWSLVLCLARQTGDWVGQLKTTRKVVKPPLPQRPPRPRGGENGSEPVRRSDRRNRKEDGRGCEECEKPW